MAEHSSLTGSDLHELKGVSTAADNTVATASNGKTVWKKLDADNIAVGTVDSFARTFFQMQEKYTSGTAAPSFTATTWNKRALNTTVFNTIDSATANTTTNQFTLPAGTYWCEVETSAVGCGKTVLRLRNVTASSDTLIGLPILSSTSGTTELMSSPMILRGRFTIASSSTFQLDHYTTSAGNGGSAVSSGAPEIYSNLTIWQLDG